MDVVYFLGYAATAMRHEHCHHGFAQYEQEQKHNSALLAIWISGSLFVRRSWYTLGSGLSWKVLRRSVLASRHPLHGAGGNV